MRDGLFLFLVSAGALASVRSQDETLTRLRLPGNPTGEFSAVTVHGDRLLAMWSPADAPGLERSVFDPDRGEWSPPATVLERAGRMRLLFLVRYGPPGSLGLLTVEESTPRRLYTRRSTDGGATWSERRLLRSATGVLTPLSSCRLDDGSVVVSVGESSGAADRPPVFFLAGSSDGAWNVVPAGNTEFLASDGVRQHILLGGTEGDVDALVADTDRYVRRRLMDGAWSAGEPVNLPAGDMVIASLSEGRRVAVGRDQVLRDDELAARVSYDGGRRWPVRRVIVPGRTAQEAAERRPVPLALLEVAPERLHFLWRAAGGQVEHVQLSVSWLEGLSRLERRPPLANVAPPAMPGRPVAPERRVSLPVVDAPYEAHVGIFVGEGNPPGLEPPVELPNETTNPVVQGGYQWIGTTEGLYFRGMADHRGAFLRHSEYGKNASGPASTAIAGLAVDSRDVLWVATGSGLTRYSNKDWQTIGGRDGLPWDGLSAIVIDARDRLWLGSNRGVIHYRPYEKGRQWFYRDWPRYLPNMAVFDLALSDTGRGVVAWTAGSYVGRIEAVERTLGGKADYLQDRLEERHRRVLSTAALVTSPTTSGRPPASRTRREQSPLEVAHPGAAIPAPCLYDDARAMKKWTFGPQPSDGLWTGYHVAAMSLAYSLTLDEKYRAAARRGMEALYLLQNVTGVPGLVARSVMRLDEPTAARHLEQDNWHQASDPGYIWRDDVSSDQIDGHYLAFYAYFEHIAQFDAGERRRIEKQVRQVTDYIIDNDYQIIDWDGKRTLWGWWDPQRINSEPRHYLESGLYSLMMLSFLKTAYYITDEPRYREHYLELAQEHGYLSNLLLEKKLFPDELNHSDDQLSAVAYYPILQLEHDPFVRSVLSRAIRRHAVIEAPERNAFFASVHATLDPEGADVAGAIQTLREIPQDRRNWRMNNSHRLDVTFQARAARNGKPVLAEVLPYDEHHFERWNQDPYRPDGGGDGRWEGAGIHYLLPYWIARYHGLLSAPAR